MFRNVSFFCIFIQFLASICSTELDVMFFKCSMYRSAHVYVVTELLLNLFSTRYVQRVINCLIMLVCNACSCRACFSVFLISCRVASLDLGTKLSLILNRHVIIFYITLHLKYTVGAYCSLLVS